ncbi:hypothetical protein [Niallia sp. 03190]|uniref:hypothetical protein n=1 Tax=Niallia sp. 03190 TaxID=3458061 RepID=UPI004043EE90
MRSGNIPHEEPNIGDWCYERTSFNDHDNRVGRLIKVLGDGEYEIETIGGKIVTWRNAELSKIPSKYVRNDTVLFG